ncbi:MAG: DUF542 domain-containing protein [Ignavibacteria bacterium]
MINYTLQEILTKKPNATVVFDRYFINYCCDENLTLAEACKNADIDPAVVIKEIEKIQHKPFEKKYNNIHGLVSDILINHHKYLDQNFAKITQLFESDLFNSGELKNVKNVFYELREVLEHHIQKEEKVLFPYIIKLVGMNKGNTKFEYSPFGSVKTVISVMNSDHKIVCNAIKLLLQTTKHFKIFSTSNGLLQQVYVSLRDLYLNLQRHMYLENYQLYPMSIELENSILNSYHKINQNREEL